jgi:hypothetical protein
VLALRTLREQVVAWAQARGWRVSAEPIQLNEPGVGVYDAEAITVETPSGRLVVEPVARLAAASDGRVDIYAWPSLNRLLLLRRHGQWRLATEAGIPWPEPWTESTLDGLAGALGRAA